MNPCTSEESKIAIRETHDGGIKVIIRFVKYHIPIILSEFVCSYQTSHNLLATNGKVFKVKLLGKVHVASTQTKNPFFLRMWEAVYRIQARAQAR